tara:strand:- start:5215 stop:5742 length:528 start_codon:yes stop_codon:yes gene_type:complete
MWISRGNINTRNSSVSNKLKLNKMKTNEFVAVYDVDQYISNEIEFFKNDKQEFLVSKLWDEERKVESVTDKEIEEYFESDYYIGEYCFEYFKDDLHNEFTKHIGKDVYVEGRKMGWRNRSGEKSFTINDPIDMFREIAPECDLTYKMEKVKEGEYEVRISHHDSPMGEYYNLKIK